MRIVEASRPRFSAVGVAALVVVTSALVRPVGAQQAAPANAAKPVDAVAMRTALGAAFERAVNEEAPTLKLVDRRSSGDARFLRWQGSDATFQVHYDVCESYKDAARALEYGRQVIAVGWKPLAGLGDEAIEVNTGQVKFRRGLVIVQVRVSETKPKHDSTISFARILLRAIDPELRRRH